jgi:hypothetical protein
MHTKSIAAGAVLAVAITGTAALAPAGAAPSHHPTAHDRSGSYRVTAKVNKTEAILNSTVKIKGSVSPAAPGAPVTLQVKYEDRKSWKTIGHGHLNAAGKVSFKDKVGSVRKRLYRIVKPAGAGHGAGQGTAPRVTVFGWRDLTSINAVQNTGFSSASSLNINGVAYPSSLATVNYGAQPFHVDYNLNRDCKQLQATFGLDDRSTASGTATLSLSTDGTQKYVGGFALTQSQKVTLNVTNVFRISLSAATASGGIGAVGSPKVLCSF